MNIIYKKAALSVLIFGSLSLHSCKKFVETDAPVDSVTSSSAFDTEAKTVSVLRALYLSMVKAGNSSFGAAMSVGLGVSADELALSLNTSTYYEFAINSINSANTGVNSFYWGPMYNSIYLANQVILHVPNSEAIAETARRQYVAEARFVRAANYFYLLNLYGDVPLAVGTDYKVNAALPRSSVAQVYDLILEDLKYAQANLSAEYKGGLTTAPRIRANRYAAEALLARVYLYRQDWANAEAVATAVIEAKGATGAALYSLETTMNNVFLLSSKEVILHLPQPSTLQYTYEGSAFGVASATTIPNYPISDALYNTFSSNDLRRASWIGSTSSIAGKIYRYPFKYKLRSGTGAKTESLAFLRLAETYLIRAEARAQQSKLAPAIADLDIVRRRAGLTTATPAATAQPTLLSLIARERFLELFAEMGHRWLDLKRRGEADEVLKTKANWRPEAKLFPIPSGDLKTNISLVQNPGYSN